MITTLSGPNSFTLRLKLNSMIKDFVARYGDLAVEQIDASEQTNQLIQEALLSLTFLSPRKLIIISSVSSNNEFMIALEQFIKEIPDTNQVILVDYNIDKRTSFYRLILKQTDFQEFKQLDTASLIKWARDYAQSKQAELSLSDAGYLVDRVGENQEKISHEIDKLAIYNNKITRENIELLSPASPNSTIFELLEAAFSGNPKQTLALYAEQRQMNVEPQNIIAMLAWQLHILLTIKTAKDRSSDDIVREAKLNPFVVKKSQLLARKLSLRDIKQLVDNLLNLDIKSKSKNLNIDDALMTYLLKISFS